MTEPESFEEIVAEMRRELGPPDDRYYATVWAPRLEAERARSGRVNVAALRGVASSLSGIAKIIRLRGDTPEATAMAEAAAAIESALESAPTAPIVNIAALRRELDGLQMYCRGDGGRSLDVPGDVVEQAIAAIKETLTSRFSDEEREAMETALSAAEYIGGFYDEREPDEPMRNFRRDCCDSLATLRRMLDEEGS